MVSKSKGAGMKFVSIEAREEMVSAVVLSLFAIIAKEKKMKFDSPDEMKEAAAEQYKTNPRFHNYANLLINNSLKVIEKEVTRIRSGRN